MLFKEFYNAYILQESIWTTIPRNVIGMSTSIQDLPDYVPYGFWVDRSGNFIEVSTCGHEDAIEDMASKIVTHLKNNNESPSDFNIGYPAYSTLFNEGWMRVVTSPNSILYEMGPNHNPTPSQEKFLKILQETYEKQQIKRDRAGL